MVSQTKRTLRVGEEVLPAKVNGKIPDDVIPRVYKIVAAEIIAGKEYIKLSEEGKFLPADSFVFYNDLTEDEHKEYSRAYDAYLERRAAGRTADKMASDAFASIGSRISGCGFGTNRLAQDVASLRRARNKLEKMVYDTQVLARDLAQKLSDIDDEIQQYKDVIDSVYDSPEWISFYGKTPPKFE